MDVDAVLFMSDDDEMECNDNYQNIISTSKSLIYQSQQTILQWHPSIDFSNYLPYSISPPPSFLQHSISIVDDMQMFFASCTSNSFLRPSIHYRLHHENLTFEPDNSAFLLTIQNSFVFAIGTGIQLEDWVSMKHIVSKKCNYTFHPRSVPHIDDSKGLIIRTSQTTIPCTPFSALYSAKYSFLWIDDHRVYSLNDAVFQITVSPIPKIPSYRKLEILVFLLHYHYQTVCQLSYILPRVAHNACRRFFQDVNIVRLLTRIAVEDKKLCLWLLRERSPPLSAPITVTEITAMMNHL